MDPVSRTAVMLVAFGGAAFTAIAAGYIAHFDIGLARDEIRTGCLAGALLIAALLATEYFGKYLRKP
jgi:hypothetical protein